MTDLYAAYNELETLLAAQQQENPDAELVIADISVKEENGNTSFMLTSGFGDDLGGGTPPTNIWWEDAADVIQYNINSNTPQPVDGYWTSISAVWVDPVWGYSTNNGVSWTTPPYNFINQNDPIPADNWWEYRMFYNYSGWPNYHLYLNPSEISFYTNKAFIYAIRRCLMYCQGLLEVKILQGWMDATKLLFGQWNQLNITGTS